MYLTNDPIAAWHRQKFGDQHTFGYKDVIRRFTAPRFDPEKWADLFACAGAKFAGPVAVHHDNFAMWDSAVTPWNSMKMGPKRDITGELAKAYRAHGLKLITTFHHGFAWRYYEPAFLFDAADGRNFQLYRKADPYRSAENLIHVLADIVAKNGCLLLNVGPNADGTIPERAEKLLLELGAWLEVNGEAIYGTRPWLVYGEGPTRSGGDGFSEGTDQAFSAQDIRFTTKGDALYAITLGWPGREFTLKAVRADAADADARVQLLGHGPLPYRINAEQQIVIDAPALTVAQLPCQHAYCFKLTGFKTSVHPSARFEQPDAIRLEPAAPEHWRAVNVYQIQLANIE